MEVLDEMNVVGVMEYYFCLGLIIVVDVVVKVVDV